MRAGDLKVFAIVIDLSDECRVGVDACFAREFYGIGSPRAIPELVDDIHVSGTRISWFTNARKCFLLLADGVSFVVFSLRLPDCEVTSSGIEIASNDVPTNAAHRSVLISWHIVCV